MLRLIRPLALGIALVGTALPGLRAQADGPLPLPEDYLPGLKSILANAVTQSPRMIARNAENAASEGNRIVARAGQLPNAGGFLGYYPWQRDYRADLPRYADVNRVNYNFSINQPLFHWGALQNATRIGEIQLRMTQSQTAEGYRLLVQEIRAQYLMLIIRKADLAKSHLGAKVTEENYSVAQTKLEKRVISDADMFMPTVNRDQARLSVDRAQEDFENSKAVFARLCGSAPLSDDQIPDAVPDVSAAPVTSLEPLLRAYTSQKDPDSYALRNIGDQIEVEKLNYKTISTRLLPTLNFQIGTSQDQTSYTTNIAAKYRVTSIFTGFMVNWTVFDGLAIRGAKATSLARRHQLEQSYKDMSADLVAQARNQLKLVDFARRDMELTNRLLTSSVGTLRDKRADATRGLASAADVSNAEIYNQDLSIKAYAARTDYLMKVGDFLSTLQQDPALANLPAKP